MKSYPSLRKLEIAPESYTDDVSALLSDII